MTGADLLHCFLLSKGDTLMKILLVEDDFIAAVAAEELLSCHFAADVETVKTGEAAVKLSKTKQYQFIFMDIGLPDISGFEATRQIKTHKDSQNTNTPIIALTGNANTETQTEGAKVGISNIIGKPLNKTKLTEVFGKT
jgi:CheY-like chemotaxis protein